MPACSSVAANSLTAMYDASASADDTGLSGKALT
jgi:hypothetical protein